MAPIQIRTGNSEGQSFEAYPADTYYCQVRNAEVTESKFKDKDGNTQYQLKLTWEVSRLTAEQAEAELETGKWFMQWFGLWYGESRKGPSNLKVFIDSLLAQGILSDFNPKAFDPDTLIGIEQRVSVGMKRGDDGVERNNVLNVAPLKVAKKSTPPAAKNAPQRIEQAPVKRPAAVAAADEDDDTEGLPF